MYIVQLNLHGLTIHRGTGARCPSPQLKVEGGAAIWVSVNAFALYCYFINGNRSVKAIFIVFCLIKGKTNKESIKFSNAF